MTGFQFTRRYDPFRDLPRDVGRLLESFEPLQSWRVPRPFPPINVYDAQDRFVIRAELPGVTPEDLDLSITGETLTLRGERRRPEGVGEDCYRRQERYFGRWSRSVTLPERVDGTRIAAQLENGLLIVMLPKSEDAKPRHIPVATSTA